MNFEALEHTWRSQAHGRLSADSAELVRELRQKDARLRSALFRRDLREVAVCLIMVPVYGFLGMRYDLPWTWYLGVPAALWIVGFLLIDRARQRRRQENPGEPLAAFVDRSLARIDHQIHLLRNVFWWYLLPANLAITAFLVHLGWQIRSAGPLAQLILFAVLAACAGVSWGVYRLNQWTVTSQLEPRRQELLTLRHTLQSGP